MKTAAQGPNPCTAAASHEGPHQVQRTLPAFQASSRVW